MCPAEAGTQPKVGELYVSISINEDVVGFDVPVDEAHPVDTLHGTGELRYVKLRQLLFEDAKAD